VVSSVDRRRPLRNRFDALRHVCAVASASLPPAAGRRHRAAGETAAEDVRDLRSLLEATKIVRYTALQTTVHVIVIATLILVVIGATIKLKLVGSGS